MKKINRFVAFALSLALVACAVASSNPALAAGGKDYTIVNPYEAVDWDSWGIYKASLHSHTNASDAVPSIAQSVEEHYRLGYDILAITDHAVLGVPWDEIPNTVPLYRMVKFGNTGMKNMEVLSEQRYAEITSGVGRNGRAMLEVTGAGELNGATPINDTHVNGFFTDYGQALMGVYGDYETVVRRVGESGGITFLDHVGEFVGCENDPDRAREPYYVNKFANIFLNNPSCIGMDVNSGQNNHTRYDYILWDEVLKMTVPYGRNVSCLCFSDGHHIDQYDRAFTFMCMPSLTVEALRESMETGAFFSVGRYARADLGEDFVGEGEPPKVTRVEVDQAENTISFTAENCDYVKWYSDGEVIAEGADVFSLDLNEYEDKIGCYLRFTITGPGGILYSQAFPVTARGEEIEKPQVLPTVDVSMFLRALADGANFLLGLTPPMILIRKLLWGRIWWIY